MSVTLVFFILAIILSLVATVFHIMMIVGGFKKSVGWGIICIFVPLGSLIFAFTQAKSKALAVVFLFAALGSTSFWGIASYQTAKASIGSKEATEVGMKEAEQQIQDLEKLDDLQLDL